MNRQRRGTSKPCPDPPGRELHRKCGRTHDLAALVVPVVPGPHGTRRASAGRRPREGPPRRRPAGSGATTSTGLTTGRRASPLLKGFAPVGWWARAITVGTRTVDVAWVMPAHSGWARDARTPS